ncbi:Pvc16 family protein [Mucilaginibacter flavus]|uniref:Pvc16 family protein n=1 Tax=Mucilaginibacter flavus TaxID=931504 RepID=UPI0025B4D67F|nr:Pvc16 family protein [Mucilaginibacter flavus]MDN3583939.1 Pvc16 family protein [Mucilaginibacter flavus]
MINFTAEDNALKSTTMIYRAVNFLAQQLNEHLAITNANLPADFTQLRNVAHLSDEEVRGLNNVLVTLLSVSEDNVLKNATDNLRGSISSKTAPKYFNLYVLFASCNYQSYPDSLKVLSQMVDFFEKNPILTHSADTGQEDSLPGFRLNVDSYAPGFEENNNMWTTMGGKQYPHMLYRVRLVEIPKPVTGQKMGVIKQFELKDRLS